MIPWRCVAIIEEKRVVGKVAFTESGVVAVSMIQGLIQMDNNPESGGEGPERPTYDSK